MKFSLTTRVNSNETLTVYILYSHDGEKYRLSTKVKIKKSCWKEDTRELIRMKDHDTKMIDDLMKELKDFVRERIDKDLAIDVYSINKTFTPKDRIQKKEDDFIISTSKPLLEVYAEYIEYCRDKRAARTIRVYKTVLYDLIEFEESYGPLSFEEMNLEFEKMYRAMLYKRGLVDNTVGSRIKNLKTFLKWANENGFEVNPEYRKMKAEKTKSMKSAKCFLLVEEIKKLASVELNDKNLDIARDLFLFQCFTGLAVSDLKELDKSHIHDDTIEKKRYKTDKDIYTPLSQEAKAILKKYDNKLPYFNEVVYNRQIKRVAKKAEIDRPIHKTTYRNEKKIILDSQPLHELLSTHDAVKSFIGLAYYEWDYNVEEISEMTSKSVMIIEKDYLGRDRKRIKSKMNNHSSLIKL